MLTALLLSASLVPSAFRELESMCARDRGRMWGVPLCGPTILVDPNSRAVIANSTFPATLPKSIGIANTAIEWDGRRWTMIVQPLPENEYRRRVLLAHESFHRIAPQLGFASRETSNAHLDTADGRYLLQLEWRALAAALGGDRTAVGDALAFRARRRQIFPNAAEDERALEINEGLAEYTGTAFAEPSIRRRVPLLIRQLRDAEKTRSFVRSFAYASGPAWGALLEMRDARWTRRLRPKDDLGELAGRGLLEAIEKRAERYGGPELLADERLRAEKQEAVLRGFRTRFIDDAVLVLPLRNIRLEFNPNEAQPFESFGTVYPTITVHDDWGTIVVTRGGA